jgi:hypothetical protein
MPWSIRDRGRAGAGRFVYPGTALRHRRVLAVLVAVLTVATRTRSRVAEPTRGVTEPAGLARGLSVSRVPVCAGKSRAHFSGSPQRGSFLGS